MSAPPRFPWRRGGSRPRRTLSLALFLALAATPLAAGDDLARAISEPWRWIHFEEDDGLPPGTIHCLADSGEVVWVGTDEGLFRYDGWRFEPVPVGAEASQVTALAVDEEDRLWVALGSELHVREPGRGAFQVHWLAPRGDVIAALTVLPDGLLLDVVDSTTKRTAVLRLGGDEVTAIPLPPDEHGDLPMMRRLWTTPGGRFWFSVPGALHWWEDGRWQEVDSAGLLDTVALAENRRGQGLAASTFQVNGRGLLEWDSGEQPAWLTDEFYGLVNVLAVAPGGEAIVVYDSRGVRVREDGKWSSPLDPPEPLLSATRLWFREDKDLWVATDDGLWLGKLGFQRWKLLKEPGVGNPRNRVNDLLLARDGRIWMATGRGVRVRDTQGRLLDLPGPEGTDHIHLTGIAQDPKGRIWVSSGSAFPGAHRWDGRRWEHITETVTGEPLGLFHKIRSDRAGRLWFLSLSPSVQETLEDRRGGVFVLGEDGLQAWSRASELPPARVYDFQETDDGAYWFATMNGVSRLAGESWRHFDVSDGLARPRVFDLADDGEGGVWVVHQTHGLGHITAEGDVRYAPETSEIGTLWSVARDERGDLWLGSNRGLLKYSGGMFTLLGLETGLNPPKVWPVVPTGERILVGSMGGGLGILSMTERDTPPPLVTFTTTSASEDRVFARWRPNAWWGARAPESIETRFRLDGRPWSDWSREHEAEVPTGYGKHTLEVQAKGLYGGLRAEPTAAVVALEHPAYRHPALIALALALAAALGVLLVTSVRRRREREAELRHSEAEHRTLIEQASDAIFLCDADTVCRKANSRALELTGRTRDQLVGQPLASICTDPDAFRDFHGHILDGRICVAEFTFVHADGEETVAEFGARQMFDGGIHLIARDVTARRRVEEQRRLLERHVTDAQRRESLAVLAGGVAHDFNNMLLVVSGNAEAALTRIGDDEVAHEQLQRILAAVRQAGALTHQLLAYAGHEPVETRCVDLRSVVEDMDTLLRASVGPSVQLELEPGDESLSVKGDVGSLRQALLSLVVNASEALGQREGVIRVRLEGDARRVRLLVEDTGPGMDPGIRERAFDPFQSTRGPGRGLGLAAVRGIATSHGGDVAIEHPLGLGCVVVLTLPRATCAPEGEKAAVATAWTPSGNVLIVDDEHGIRDVLAVMVERMGFGVVTASEGEEAILAYGREDDFVCALVDLSMPKMSGLEVLEALKALRPEVPAILMSGYSEDMFDARRDAAAALLRKPFSYDELRARIGEAVVGARQRDVLEPRGAAPDSRQSPSSTST